MIVFAQGRTSYNFNRDISLVSELWSPIMNESEIWKPASMDYKLKLAEWKIASTKTCSQQNLLVTHLNLKSIFK